MKWLRQRFEDWQHERLVRRLSADVKRLIADGQYAAARKANDTLTNAITARSPDQVKRMELAKGLR